MMLENLWGHTIVEKDDMCYFSSVYFNGLFKVDKYTGITEYISQFEGEDIDYFNIHWHTYRDANDIIFIPRRGHYLHIFNVETKKIEKICVSQDVKDFHIFTDVTMNGDNVYLKSTYGKKYTVCCDIRKKEVKFCDEGAMKGTRIFVEKANETFLECIGREKNVDFYSQIAWYKYSENQVYSLDPYGKHILIFNEKEKIIDRIKLKISNLEVFDKLKDEIKKENVNANILYEEEYEWQLQHFITFIKNL